MRKFIFLAGLIMALLLAGCSGENKSENKKATSTPQTTQEATVEAENTPVSAATQEATAEANVALRITGQVKNEMNWTEDEVRAMDTKDVQSTNSKGEISTYTGVPLSALLALAEPTSEATAVTFIGDDGSQAEVSLTELNACTDCIISFRNKGGFSVVLPSFPSDAQIKGVVEINVK